MVGWTGVKLATAVIATLGVFLGLSAMRVEQETVSSVGTVVDPAATGGGLWSRNTPGSPARVDHAPWTVFLQGATLEVRGITKVAFSSLRGDPRKYLDAYVDWLTTLRPSEWERTEQLAYWLNLHNALTVQAIADAGSRGTIDRVRQFPVAQTGPFAERRIMIEGQPLSIDAIVHEVLRPNFADMPFHYGLFTGAAGAPKLRRMAYEGSTVVASLDQQARAFINGHGVRVSRRALELSTLYDWYAADFGGSHDAILRHVQAYADDRLRDGLQERTTIDRFQYNLAIASVIPRRYTPEGGIGLYGSGTYGAAPSSGVGGGS